MKKTILNNTGTANRSPRPDEIIEGELVLNYADKALYFKDKDGLISKFTSDSVITPSIGAFTKDTSVATPHSVEYYQGMQRVTRTHQNMRKCLVLDSGTVNYYLDPRNSSRKADGSAAILTGTDGQVMVEIPKFYTKFETNGVFHTWSISDKAFPGFTVHPAFIKDGLEVDFRYYGAYDASVFDTSASSFVNGLNLDNSDSIYTYTEDRLASVASFYPAVGISRAQARQLARNRGTGWRQLDFWLVQAIQLLYIIEYQSFFSQSVLGEGNTKGSYLASSSIQSDSPHTIAGSSNSFGNNSTNVLSGASINVKPGTSFMSYRGIENFFGNCWNWVDGFNIFDQQAWVSNTTSHFNDNTSTNYTALGARMPQSDGFVSAQQTLNNAFLTSGVTGSSTTYWTDYYYQATGWRVAMFGGDVINGPLAGAFYWNLGDDSSARLRSIGARLAR